MPKRTLFTNITPLPPQVSREVAIAMLHNHDEMIELNPLVIEHHPIKTPRDAPADEFLDCAWQELTDKIHFLPGGMMKGKVSYKACFHDMPNGLQTHIYAPMGLDIREKWTIGGTLPGEPPEPRELGLDVPREGLYIREDGDMKCNMLMTSFVRKNLDNAHKVLVERILKKAERVEETVKTMGMGLTPITPGAGPGTPRFQAGSHMSNSQIVNSPAIYNRPLSPQMLSPQQDLGWQTLANHPAFRNEDKRMSYHQQAVVHPQRMSYYAALKQQQQPEPPKQFVAELPGSMYHTGHLAPPSRDAQVANHRMSTMSELTGSDGGTYTGSPNHRMSTMSELSASDPSRDSLVANHRISTMSELSGSASDGGTYTGSPNQQAQSEAGSIVSENFYVQKLNNAHGYPRERPQSMVSRGSGHSSSYLDRMSMVSELPSTQPQQWPQR
ncbi:hypothetical protein A1O7_01561 [Cladophialophora yegresii CBS 114405]|uniref:DUF7053 domain-containing protein n=1 Tax=Cladophialophora yegresii CBS 114405 TaxID=1182544 RepID=W9WJQ4_9EURO|nr:uncharacterized protein A1O7_01561 [Cladophialophora yegresii CBS 114405]EXJ65220.1 hypothetical protein A1O7_01561 [Cladophialophora yegresii CBS 114405]